MSAETTEKAVVVKRAPPSVPTLRLLFSGEAGIVDRPPYVLPEGGLAIGRAVPEEGAICLDQDRRVSRVHAIVQVGQGGPPGRRQLRVLDVSHNNGTFVNGQRVEEAALKEGDLLRVGDSFLLVRYETPGQADAPVPGLLGEAPALRGVRATVRLVGPSLATVLLLGESGSGKEVVARALHAASGRSAGPFVAVNCSAITESLAESQLFGHVPGAFTGAAAHPGFFRAASGGTLFLDEVGELAPAMQPKLLRALEERAVVPVGAVSPVPCDIRLVAATNRDLTRAVEAGRFRGDLYARLAEILVHLPPLRERREDVLPLLQQALGVPAPEPSKLLLPPPPARTERPTGGTRARGGPVGGAPCAGVAAPRLAEDLVEALLLYHWPYNVREVLKLATELRLRGAGAPVLHLDLVADRLAGSPLAPAPADTPRPTPAPSPEVGRPQEVPIPDREELLRLLREHKGNIADVARATGRSRRQVYRWLEQHGLDAEKFRG